MSKTQEPTCESGYEEIIVQVLSEIAEVALKKYRNENDKIAKYTDELVADSQKVYELPLDAEPRKLIDRYISLHSVIAGLNNEYLYVQGAKDGVKLLKELGAL